MPERPFPHAPPGYIAVAAKAEASVSPDGQLVLTMRLRVNPDAPWQTTTKTCTRLDSLRLAKDIVKRQSET